MKKEMKNLIFAIITIMLPILIIKIALYSAQNILFLKQDVHHELKTYNNGEVSQIKMDNNYLSIWSSLLGDLNFNESNMRVSKYMSIKIDAYHNFLNHEIVDTSASIEITTSIHLLDIIKQTDHLSITKKGETYEIMIHSDDIPVYYEYKKIDTMKENRLFYTFNEINLQNEFNENIIKIIIYIILIVIIIVYDILLIVEEKR